MKNKFTEIAVARTLKETELTIAAFSGPVLRNRKNSATNSAGTDHFGGPKKTSAPHGSVRATLQNETRYSARWFVRSQRCAIQPPTTVPAMPSITVMPLTTRLELATLNPAER